MKIKSEYKVRQIAGENVVILQGCGNSDLTQIITLNDSALLLWNQLEGKDFSVEDVAKVLVDTYGINDEQALQDMAKVRRYIFNPRTLSYEVAKRSRKARISPVTSPK